jgi:hypothetical protein
VELPSVLQVKHVILELAHAQLLPQIAPPNQQRLLLIVHVELPFALWVKRVILELMLASLLPLIVFQLELQQLTVLAEPPFVPLVKPVIVFQAHARLLHHNVQLHQLKLQQSAHA